jgi:MOSC domain-containing protein YiiM
MRRHLEVKDERTLARVGEVVAVSTSEVRTEPKRNHDRGRLIAGYGVEGDSHAGISEREVSLLGIEAIRALNQEHDAGAVPGSFAENITTLGVDLPLLTVGQRLKIGECMLEVVEIGKPLDEAHTYDFKGFSLLPTKGIFCRVLESGQVTRGDSICLID